MTRACLIILALLAAPPAFAHGEGAPIGPWETWHHWNFDPVVWAPILISHWLYGRGVTAAWARAGRGRIIPVWRVASFLAGELALVIALLSPLDPLGGTLLSAHMAQHILLTAIAPPLLVLGLPVRAWTWAIPLDWRRLAARPAARTAAALLDRLSRPVAAAMLSVAAMCLWHIPSLFETALESNMFHALEHISFLGTSLLAWRAALSAGASALASALATLLVFMTGGLLGGLLTLAPVVLYDWYGGSSQIWGLSPVEDQQLAGLLMWVVSGGAYLAAFAVFAFRCATPARRELDSSGIMRASTSSRSMK